MVVVRVVVGAVVGLTAAFFASLDFVPLSAVAALDFSPAARETLPEERPAFLSPRISDRKPSRMPMGSRPRPLAVPE